MSFAPEHCFLNLSDWKKSLGSWIPPQTNQIRVSRKQPWEHVFGKHLGDPKTRDRQIWEALGKRPSLLREQKRSSPQGGLVSTGLEVDGRSEEEELREPLTAKRTKTWPWEADHNHASLPEHTMEDGRAPVVTLGRQGPAPRL